MLVTLALGGFMLTNKGFSPQYMAWLAPLLLVAWPNATGLVYTAAWSLYLVSYYTITAPSMGAHALGYLSDQQIAVILWISILVRSALLAVTLGHLVWLAWQRGRAPVGVADVLMWRPSVSGATE